MTRRVRGIGMTSERTRARLVERLRAKGIRNETVLQVMESTPRHIFMDEALASRAYEDTALPIGFGQTISQPYIVARMTEVALDGAPLRRVLEVGTGSGYQTAVLAQLADQVYSVERIEPFIRQARWRFSELGLRNIRMRHVDGHIGWSEAAPYDAIVVTAAPEEVPKPLLRQLGEGGQLLIPVGEKGKQELKRIRRHGDEFHVEYLEAVSFVPLRVGDRA